jgi:hypothetical protein
MSHRVAGNYAAVVDELIVCFKRREFARVAPER